MQRRHFFSPFFYDMSHFSCGDIKERAERKIRGVGENKCCMEFEIMHSVCVFPSCLNQRRGGRVALGLLLVTVSVFLDFSPPPFQRQSWIEKRGGTGCGLVAEGELNSHSLSLSLSLLHFLFFSVAFKINSFSGLLTQPGPESPGFMAPSNGHALNQSPAVSTILPATRPPRSLTPSSF